MAIKDVIAGAVKTVRAAGAAVTGEPPLIARLKGEHAEVSTMMATILSKKDGSDVADPEQEDRRSHPGAVAGEQPADLDPHRRVLPECGHHPRVAVGVLP